VLTIVKKLFMAVAPDMAFFGEKDFQQLAIIRRMTVEEGLPIQIIAAPTIRESSGLAMSSRNVRLSHEDRVSALAISKALLAARAAGRSVSPENLQQKACADLLDVAGIRLEYCALVKASDFAPVKEWTDEPCVLLVAAYVGDVRLIDNVIID
jgi:pantoate--beta-alanine ligase